MSSLAESMDHTHRVLLMKLIEILSSCTDDELDRICDQFGIGGCHGTV